MENKFLKYIKDNKDNTFLSELEKKNIALFLEIIKKSIPDNSGKCNHDIEDICMFFENEINNKVNSEKIRNIIFDCDNCFDTYSFLKDSVPEITNLTPEYIKEKVKDTSISLELKKKSFWYILKNNKTLRYSSGAVAAMFLLFFSINPLDTNMSDFHKSKESSILEDSNVSSESSEKAKVQGLNVSKAPQATIQNKPFPKEYRERLIKEDLLKTSGMINPVMPQKSVVDENKLSKKVESETLKRVLNKNNKLKVKKENRLDEISKSVEEKRQIDNLKSDSDNVKNSQVGKIESSNDKVIAPPVVMNPAPRANNESDSKGLVKSEPIPDELPKTQPLKNEPELKKENNNFSGLSTNTLKLRNTTLKQKKSEEEIILNFNLENDSFVIVKDLDNNIIGQTSLLKSGYYKNFALKIKNTDKKYLIYIYLDSNKTGSFDTNDLLIRTL